MNYKYNITLVLFYWLDTDSQIDTRKIVEK